MKQLAAKWSRPAGARALRPAPVSAALASPSPSRPQPPSTSTSTSASPSAPQAAPRPRPRQPRHAPPSFVPAAAAPSAPSAPSAPGAPGGLSSASGASVDSPEQRAEFDFVCPICLTTEFRMAAMPTSSGPGLSCPRCARTFPASPDYLDLTTTAGVPQRVYNQKAWGGTEIFRSPLVSFAYERGWRQGFAWAGFPGADREYEMALSYLLPAAEGRLLVDMSCGSGLFSRRFARSGRFAGVVAADFSENMLKQTRQYCLQEGGTLNGTTPIMLVRADVGRLPFATGSVAALHAGAAIHCWPNPQAALAEISRVLAPGGVFVGTTFLNGAAPLGQVLGDENVRALAQLDQLAGSRGGQPYRWWEEAELRELCEGVGLKDFRRDRSWRFIMFAATKPGGERRSV
ncbi:hypothetical protein HYH03_015380 [Edaphochlamys debaryana]|uniref:Methyltransferase type 11 domain-containing protein n=1 Tax=Edaphochlamys debaryana TaxID=47281 RepID=A0A836BQZ7_9CHLO|nr:hypothetical protein HYH03_015380 [Edaphochlamys debaryana]|eukprot:KAG2485936.1 hypothetical protein HYH03_015380 [Edaphochlamys debaryana]